MKSEKVFSRNDCARILDLFDNYQANNETEKELLDILKQQISKSRQMDDEKINENFVTMDSRIVLKNIGNGSRDIYHLVLPDDSDIKNKKISILSGIGTQILGSRIGTVIKEKPGSEKYFIIEDIIQIQKSPDS